MGKQVFSGVRALKFLNCGTKIRHMNWYYGKYVILNNAGLLVDESGKDFPISLFNENSSKIWVIYNESYDGVHNDKMEFSGGTCEQGFK